MTEASQHSPSPQSKSRFTGFRAQWSNPRGIRFWAVTLILLYTLAGFFLLPYLVKKGLVDFLQGDLGRETRIEKVEFNPYALSLRITGLNVDDTDDVKLAGFREFFVNFQLSSVFYRAWTFDEIRLDGLYFFFQRFDAENSRVSRLLDDIASLPTEPDVPEPEPEEEAGGIPRLLVRNLSLGGGVLDIRDDVPETPVSLQVNPIDIAISELSTLPDRTGHQEVTIKLPEGLALHWEGSLDLAPFESEGQLVLENAQLARGLPYLQAMLPLESLAATLSSRFDYRIFVADGVAEVRIDNLDINLDDVAVTGLSPGTEFLTLDTLALKGGAFRYPEQTLSFRNLHIERPEITAWRKPDGTINFADLAPSPPETPEIQPEAMVVESGSASAEPEGNSPPAEAGITAGENENTTKKAPASPWVIGVDLISLADGRANFTDYTIDPPAQLVVAALNIECRQFSTEDGARMPVSLVGKLPNGGQVNVDGSVSIAPATALELQLKTTDLPLSIAQAYIQQYLRVVIENGLLNTDLKVAIPANQGLEVAGSLQIATLDIRDSSQKSALLAWQRLALNRLKLDTDANTLEISALEFQQPYARFAIHEDLSTNVSDLLVSSDGDGEAAEAASANNGAESAATDSSPMQVVIGGIRIDNAELDFSDMSLPLPFATHVHSLNGAISSIATTSSESSKIKLEGQVNEYGLARIEGDVNLLDPLSHTDVALKFRNLDMSRMSPYSGRFAGRKISDGRLTLDLNYLIDKGILKADNHIVLSNLRLGDKIDSPDATSLPLDLAIALLKDPDGVIDAKIPVTGDVNDPRFALSGVIWDAIVGLITDVATAPFRFLGNMLGIKAEDLGQIQFLAGRADLTPPELEKISHLQRALSQRPQLAIEISGGYDPATDTPALQFITLRDTLIEKFGASLAMENNETMLADDLLATLESLFKEQFPDTPLKTLQAAHKAPPADDPEGKVQLDKLAYSADLRDRLLAAQPIGEPELKQLAKARAEAIKVAFLSSGNIDQARITLVEPGEVRSGDGEWVTLELGVAP